MKQINFYLKSILNVLYYFCISSVYNTLAEAHLSYCRSYLMCFLLNYKLFIIIHLPIFLNFRCI